jgi:RecJ-like exonuclease
MNKTINRFNKLYDLEMSSSNSETYTNYQMQAMTLDCMLKAFYIEHDNDCIIVEDIKNLIDSLHQEHQNYCKFISRHYKDKINEINLQ